MGDLTCGKSPHKAKRHVYTRLLGIAAAKCVDFPFVEELFKPLHLTGIYTIKYIAVRVKDKHSHTFSFNNNTSREIILRLHDEVIELFQLAIVDVKFLCNHNILLITFYQHNYNIYLEYQYLQKKKEGS